MSVVCCCASPRRAPVPVSLREDAIKALGTLHAGPPPVGDATAGYRKHIVERLQRLCSIPDEPGLAFRAKETLEHALALIATPPPTVTCWQRVIRCGAASPPAQAIQSSGGGSVSPAVNVQPDPLFYKYTFRVGPLYGNRVPSKDSCDILTAVYKEVRRRALFKFLS